MQQNTIPANSHVMVCGATGTGKSYLAETYLRGYQYVVKLDTKQETDERYRDGKSPWYGLREGKDFTVVRHFEQLDEVETDKIIYVPDFDDMNEKTFNDFFRWIFLRQNTVLWIDELMSIGTAHTYPRELGRLMQQGRSKNIGVWSCTQRPASIPAIVPASSVYFFIFNLYLNVDRKKVMDITGQSQFMTLPKDHNFWYYKMGEQRPIRSVLVDNN